MLDKEFLDSIVWVDGFTLTPDALSVKVLCIEDDSEVKYSLDFIEVNYFVFRQEEPSTEFSVIDTFLERFNDSPFVDFMRSDKWVSHSVIRFHSGTHHLLVGFKGVTLAKRQ